MNTNLKVEYKCDPRHNFLLKILLTNKLPNRNKIAQIIATKLTFSRLLSTTKVLLRNKKYIHMKLLIKLTNFIPAKHRNLTSMYNAK